MAPDEGRHAPVRLEVSGYSAEVHAPDGTQGKPAHGPYPDAGSLGHAGDEAAGGGGTADPAGQARKKHPANG